MAFKKILLSLIIIFLLAVIGKKIWFYAIFSNAQREANEIGHNLWYNNEFLPSDYCGNLKYIDSKHKKGVILTIYTDSKKRITYSICGHDSELLNFISAGDSICKKRGSFLLTIIKKNKKKDFELDFKCK